MKKTALPLVVGSFVALWSAAPTIAAEANSVASDMGKGLTQTLCASCHNITADPSIASPNPAAPKFKTVANKPDITRDSLRKFLKTTHSNAFMPLAMPNPHLTDDEFTKIASYVMSLRDQR